MQTMSKETFVDKMIHKIYLKKLEKKNKREEIDEYVSDSKLIKYKHRISHARRK